ncbi:hypothetical protein SAMN05444411_104213 [Lutibacter oricola]|uniref:Outer membrane protein beta-barrel domain-containing protein n=1 Tax=Lutibacter oricola TaxID=762486 RepID=A0A1H3AS51_9FLAO|nr:hypothetical protein [Lutibacter oricola]SDX32473.1 hypothetical protein SAMN05444411_104213 [Lutibacter oricola]
MRIKVLVCVTLLASISMFSQDKTVDANKVNYNDAGSNKGKMFAHWGWNRGHFSNSDITFKGEDYNFTIKDVVSDDKPKPFGIYYFKPDEITIPQTNFRIGYFFKENYTVALGVDHMKYVMRNNQNVTYSGNLPAGSEIFTSTGNTVLLHKDFLTFEHTDGLNYVNVEVSRFDNLDNWLKFPIKNIDINLTEGVGVGLLYPKTNTKLLGKERYDDFHVSGYGISAHVGLNVTFFKHFFIQSNMKVGYINMNDIRTTESTKDSASQHFTFFENMYVFGARFRLFK